MTGRIRVLVVDDSAFARKVLREVLAANPHIEVVGFARDGLEALESIAALEPDVVTLDLIMPNLDGIGVLRHVRAMRARPRIVVVSISGEDSELVVEALQLGAVEVVRKPTALATDRLYELSDALTRAVLQAAAARSPKPSDPTDIGLLKARAACRLVVIGTSTGGPQALSTLLPCLPADIPAAVAVALHIPGDYTQALARRLNAMCALEVVEASDGLELRAGLVMLAKGGVHLRIEREGSRLVARLSSRPESLYVPSVDVLFQTASEACGTEVLGVVLTGMGDDGLLGSRAIVAAGGRVLTEAESSCVIYGMPRAIAEAGYSAEVATIDSMAGAIVRNI